MKTVFELSVLCSLHEQKRKVISKGYHRNASQRQFPGNLLTSFPSTTHNATALPKPTRLLPAASFSVVISSTRS